jgi:hypothetical protein
MTDADVDGYPSATTQIAQASAPTNGRRRNLLTSLTQADANDASACATNGASAGTCQTCLNGGPSNASAGTDPNNQCTASLNSCSGNTPIGPDGNCNGSGACNTGGNTGTACSTAGTCQTGGGCSGGSCVAVSNAAAYNQGTNCTGTCTGCNGSGTCVNIPNMTKDTWGSNTCSATNYTCNGSAGCYAPKRWMCCSGGCTPNCNGYGGCEFAQWSCPGGGDYCSCYDSP